jgi:hypothetical protein
LPASIPSILCIQTIPEGISLRRESRWIVSICKWNDRGAVLSAVEPCSSFDVVGNREAKRLEIRRRRRKCLYLYFYFVDARLGLIDVRLQGWFPSRSRST